MTAYRRVYDSRHLQADCKKTGISSGTLRSAIEYGLPLPFLTINPNHNQGQMAAMVVFWGEGRNPLDI